MRRSHSQLPSRSSRSSRSRTFVTASMWLARPWFAYHVRNCDSAAAAREPDERRQVNGELRALCPACVAPPVAQTASGAMRAADQKGELVESDGVLLRD